MATIKEIIERVDEYKINAFSEKQKLTWLAELEGLLALNVFLMDIEEAAQFQYKHPADLQTVPMVKFPHDRLYDAWLEARIDYENGEYDRYQNSMENYNAAYGDFVRWFSKWYRPADGHYQRQGDPPYYLTAYGLAVSQGFRGTLDEWLDFLIGPQGEKGDKGETGPRGATIAYARLIAGQMDDGQPVVYVTGAELSEVN